MTLKWEASAFKNPLSRARGLGSLHEGAHHWLAQRVTALSNLGLGIWAICSMTTLVQGTYADMHTWIASFPNSVLLALFILSTFTMRLWACRSWSRITFTANSRNCSRLLRSALRYSRAQQRQSSLFSNWLSNK